MLLSFTGRRVGAIGICYPILHHIDYTTDKEAIREVYNHYEHISGHIKHVTPEGIFVRNIILDPKEPTQ